MTIYVCIYFMKSTRTRTIFSNDFTLARAAEVYLTKANRRTCDHICMYILYEIYTYTFDFLKRFYTQNDRVRVNKATSTRTRYKFIFSTSLLLRYDTFHIEPAYSVSTLESRISPRLSHQPSGLRPSGSYEILGLIRGTI